MSSEKSSGFGYRNKNKSSQQDQNETDSASDDPGTRRMIVEDIHDLAKLGGDLFKRTMSSGFEAIKEVTDGIPKEASHLISKGKEEVLKGLSKEVLQNVMMQTVDRIFAKVRQHKLEVTIGVRLKQVEELPEAEDQKSKKK
jgi:hypothetical protein